MLNPKQKMAEARNKLPSVMKTLMMKGREKYGESWLTRHEPRYYLRRAEEKFFEFRQAVEHERHLGRAIEELGDVCNFALMFAIRSLHDDEEDTNDA